MKHNQNMAILLYSCYKNRDMWTIFCKLFRKYWSNCPYPVILLTDRYKEGPWQFDEVVELDENWHDMIMAGLVKAGTEYVMLFMDDYLLCDYVKTDKIQGFVEDARKYHAANIRLIVGDGIPYASFENNPDFSYYKPGTAYSMCTQPGIWNADWLRRNVKPEWSAWDFERIGSIEIIDEEHPLLGTKTYVFPYEEGVRRGKWMDAGVKVCRRNGIKLDFNRRKRMSSFEMAWIYFMGGILELNPTFVVKVQNWMQGRKQRK